MSELKGAKMEGSKVPAEEIKNPNLVAAIEKMQDDNTTENINKMIDEVMKAKFILPAKVTPKTEAKTTNGQTGGGTSPSKKQVRIWKSRWS